MLDSAAPARSVPALWTVKIDFTVRMALVCPASSYLREFMVQSEAKTLLLLKPRGFCAGVVRAIDIVERALEK